MRSLRMIAVKATLEGFPAVFMRSYCALRSGLFLVAMKTGR